ncbi:oligopeptide/dipeptide ABC transporter ATP-binding protein [Collinsella sp. An2]|uniref:ABC transporter ATP-binding protein n=1 Tax=Collinsella sp. An2 TaxID=1965585 RepID=UPI000B36DC97|nr:oligopeptide/dipeptide ABC transporter ATP-binding protein [Collinsella sp. An2]OUP07454.1 peptide ABC transporter ATP-binding protein [Collinsella sp. An2]
MPVNDYAALLRAEDIHKTFPVSHGRQLKAVDGVDVTIFEDEVVGLVGESGCGKSTLGRTLLKLHEPTSGKIIFDGEDITDYSRKQMRPVRQKMQMVFQDPFASLNPRMRIRDSVRAPLDAFGIGTREERDERVRALLEYVGLGANHIDKYPHELSGGQRQRVVIARAVILGPKLVVCDEAVSALDVSIRAQVLNLMKDLQYQQHLSYLFISHDMSVIRFICDRIMVMYLGQVVEVAGRDELFENPAHPYTQALMSAIPVPDVDHHTMKIELSGDVPSPLDPPQGCRFHTRCPYAKPECSKTQPIPVEIEPGHAVSCLKYA